MEEKNCCLLLVLAKAYMIQEALSSTVSLSEPVSLFLSLGHDPHPW